MEALQSFSFNGYSAPHVLLLFHYYMEGAGEVIVTGCDLQLLQVFYVSEGTRFKVDKIPNIRRRVNSLRCLQCCF